MGPAINISIHALREEGDDDLPRLYLFAATFQSTPSVRRATKTTFLTMLAQKISIHALREEGDSALPPNLLRGVISIHALREEGDARFADGRLYAKWISIHALREEGDHIDLLQRSELEHFNPRPP